VKAGLRHRGFGPGDHQGGVWTNSRVRDPLAQASSHLVTAGKVRQDASGPCEGAGSGCESRYTTQLEPVGQALPLKAEMLTLNPR
jgi:hypothetical protein